MADDRGVEDRLRELEDRAEITDLSQRYNLAVDDSDWPALTALFAPEARLGDHVGPGPVVELIRSMREPYGRTRHVSHGALVTITGLHTATGVVPSSSELDIGGRSYRAAIRYIDRYQRCDGRWLFLRRKSLIHYVLPYEELADSMSASDSVRWPGRERTAANL